ncbi:hypothetical protein JTB14_019471 [Gonioctena quinquepunctata]|nr:hypothetical protein JTB14_019471 [Gonioctena quinquepunctata]
MQEERLQNIGKPNKGDVEMKVTEENHSLAAVQAFVESASHKRRRQLDRLNLENIIYGEGASQSISTLIRIAIYPSVQERIRQKVLGKQEAITDGEDSASPLFREPYRTLY